ncbi:hypothetical protein Tsubulata_009228 [Turnera subulata]|uniref:Uncharacterized protein n=1 Tax=Turnera subulata TaxID=218843 RepID=A0A9Q0J020_9ROSI|nr:hypothetical protein Tsubulata_009228 [Turnera subulata]
MMKRSSSRTSRPRGIKVKHVLQICLLVGVCFWLIYQVKHSHDKKKEFNEKNEEVSAKVQTGDEILKLGRKDLHPREKDSAMTEDEEDETGVEEEENKNVQEQDGGSKQEEDGAKNEGEEREEGEENAHDDEEREGAKHDEKDIEEENEEQKAEEAEDDSRGGGDDDIVENNHDKIEAETDREEDFVEEEKEVDLDSEEKDAIGQEGEENVGEADHDTSRDEQEQDEGNKSVHEAREEHYKADDASSAVTHEPEKETSENLNEKVASEIEQENNSTSNNAVDGNQSQNNSTSQLAGQELSGTAPLLNITNGELKDGEIILSNSEDKLANATFTTMSNNQPELTNKTTEVTVEAGNNTTMASVGTSGSSQQNETVIVSDVAQADNATLNSATTGEVPNLPTTESEQVKNDAISGTSQSDPVALANTNLTVPSEVKSNHTTDGDTSESSDKNAKPEVTAEGEVSGTTQENKEDTHIENSNADNESSGTDENSDSSTTSGNGDLVSHDPIDSSDSSVGQEERQDRIDLSTLPETSTNVINSADVAAE